MEDLKKKSSSDSSWSDENEVVRKKDFQVVKQVRKLSVFLKSASMIISFMFFFRFFLQETKKIPACGKSSLSADGGSSSDSSDAGLSKVGNQVWQTCNILSYGILITAFPGFCFSGSYFNKNFVLLKMVFRGEK